MFERLGGPPERTLQAMLRDPAHAAEALRRIEEYWKDHEHEAQPYPGAHEALNGLRQRGIELGLWTGRDHDSTGRMLQVHGFADRFTTTVCGDDLASHKPDPAGLREVLRRLAVRPDEAIYLGDAAVDVQAGAACGVRTVLIHHGRPIAPEAAAQAWRSVETPAEAYALVSTETGA
jgi:HAD superfamily hydrolase (TIGR01509 family)